MIVVYRGEDIMRKAVIVSFGLACAGMISGDDLAWSKQPQTCPPAECQKEIFDEMTLNPPEALTRKEFACVQQASISLQAYGQRLIGGRQLDTVDKRPVATKIDEATGYVKIVTPTHLLVGNPDGTSYKILHNTGAVIIAEILGTGTGHERMELIVIDRKTSKMLLISGGMYQTELNTTSEFYDCRTNVALKTKP
jgi:hypothetical protein